MYEEYYWTGIVSEISPFIIILLLLGSLQIQPSDTC